jgi:hypothetical protein
MSCARFPRTLRLAGPALPYGPIYPRTASGVYPSPAVPLWVRTDRPTPSLVPQCRPDSIIVPPQYVCPPPRAGPGSSRWRRFLGSKDPKCWGNLVS